MEEYTKLVYFIYNRHFRNYSHLKDDLVSEGFLALCRAEKYFDETKETKKSNYLGKVIYMAMLKFIKKEQKHFNNISLDTPINSGENISLGDTIPYDEDLFEVCSNRQILSKLIENEKDIKTKQIVSLYLEGYTQKEIGEIVGMNQSHVSKCMINFRTNAFRRLGGDRRG